MRSHVFRGTAILLCGLAAAGCEDVTGSSGISLTLGSQTLEVAQGANNTVSISVARDDFDGDVTLSATGLPTGVTATFTPATLSDGSTASTLTIEASGTATTGDASVTITASGADVDDATATLNLTVTEGGSFALTATPATLNLTRSGTVNTTVTISRDAGFTGAVSLSASGLPAGVTASFDPASTTGGSSVLTLTASGSATLGSATVTVTGASTGVASQSTNLALTVVAAGGTQQLTVDFCASDAPTWVAYQNEGGAWTRLTLDANLTGSAQITPKVSLALVFVDDPADGGEADVEILHTTAAELAPVNGVTCVEEAEGDKMLNGSVANASSHFVQVAMAFGFASVAPPDNTFTIFPPLGASDLVATRTPESDPNFLPDKVIVRRGLNIPDGGTIPVLDFNATEAAAMASNTLTVTGAGSDPVTMFHSFVTSIASENSTFMGLQSGDVTGSMTFMSVPAALTTAEDRHVLDVQASDEVTFDDVRGATAFFSDPANKTLAIGAVLAAPTVTTAATSPYYRPRVQLAAGEYTGAVSFELFDNVSGNDLDVFISRNFLGSGPTTWDFTMPDLSGVSGWDNAWALQGASDLEIYVNAYSEPLNFITEFGADNTIVKYAAWDNVDFSRRSALRSTTTAGPRARPRMPRVTWHGVQH